MARVEIYPAVMPTKIPQDGRDRHTRDPHRHNAVKKRDEIRAANRLPDRFASVASLHI
jgi:hypothetical protein